MTVADFIGLAIDILVGATFIWLGMKFAARVIAGMQPGASYCSWWEILIAAAAAAVVALIPGILGDILAWAVLFALLIRFTGGTIFEVVVIVFWSRIAATVVGIWVFPYLPSWH
jgi:hypothetical protein